VTQIKGAKICILSTGGTIASVYDERIQALRPGLSVDALIETLPKGLQNVEVSTKELFNLDSANAQPYHWQEVAKAIRVAHEEDPELDGIVITHGTDTMVYTASAISLMVQDFGKPIVFTGSQIPASVPWSDGPRNLIDAIRVAAFADLAETCIVFNSEIHRANRARKVREGSYDAFDSMDPTPIGVLSRDIVLYEGRKRREETTPRFDTRLDPQVFLVKIFPGFPPETIVMIAEQGYHGIVIEGFGSGNIPVGEKALTGAILKAVEQDCIVIISTQCAFGQADLSLYEVGRAALEVGALSAYDMTSETTLVKLMWSLGHTRDFDRVREMMLINYAGEISFSPGAGVRGT
jgi:L-asparaginase